MRQLISFAVLLFLVGELALVALHLLRAPMLPPVGELGWLFAAALPVLVTNALPVAAVAAVAWVVMGWRRDGSYLGLQVSGLSHLSIAAPAVVVALLVAIVTGLSTTRWEAWGEERAAMLLESSVRVAPGRPVVVGETTIIADEDGSGLTLLDGGLIVAAQDAEVRPAGEGLRLSGGELHWIGEGVVVAGSFEEASLPLGQAGEARASAYARAIELKRYVWPLSVALLIVVTALQAGSGAWWAGGVAWLLYWALVRTGDFLSVQVGAVAAAWGPFVVLLMLTAASARRAALR